MTAGAIAVAYNLPDCDLKLTQEQLAAIFLGKIKNFSDVGCDDKAITVVRRSDGSGTTYNFTQTSLSHQRCPEERSWYRQIRGLAHRRRCQGQRRCRRPAESDRWWTGLSEVAYVKGKLKAAALANASGEQVKPTNESESTALADRPGVPI